MRLSRNLSLSEVIKSNTATRLGISNLPTKTHLRNLKQTAEKVFQPIRDHFGTAIYVSSGYRSKALNEAINGSKTSDHPRGRALDLDQDNRNTTVSNRDIFDYALANLDFDQLIFEYGTDSKPDWVHISYRGKEENRHQVLRVQRIEGKSVYTNYVK